MPTSPDPVPVGFRSPGTPGAREAALDRTGEGLPGTDRSTMAMVPCVVRSEVVEGSVVS